MGEFFDFIVHGGDYNPDQWLKYPEIIDKDMELMKAAHINSATIGIFSWGLLEPEEDVYNFEWLDNIMDKLHENGISVILATPSGARPNWMAQAHPEVLRVEETGIRNEYGVRHNHCLTSPYYRMKVNKINRLLAERYKNHPALKMWHISNEYCDCCHCELCQEAFRNWVKNYYHNDLEELNEAMWSGFWAHQITDWSQISSPKFRGENHVPALKLAWDRFVTDSHISFYENEIAPLREITPHIPITTNCMRDSLNYQKFASHLDLMSWDNYPAWGKGNDKAIAAETAFAHDSFRSMKGGKPFFMMESTPSIANWMDVNKLPAPGMQTVTALQAVAHGADSVQYFQWRKSRGGHEKYHGAVVGHDGTGDTRVFKEVAETGKILEKLKDVSGTWIKAKVAIIWDLENFRAIKHFHGYNNKHRDYTDECRKWYKPFYEMGITTDVIPMDADYSQYDLIVAPFLYMLKDGTGAKIKEYVENGGTFMATYLTAMADKNDLCYLGGFPGDGLREVFGVWAEETDSLPDGQSGKMKLYKGSKEYSVDKVCDILRTEGAEALGEYLTDFYKHSPAVTVNNYGNGKAYYVAFRNDEDFAADFVNYLVKETGVKAETAIKPVEGVIIRKRGDFVFLFNFADGTRFVELDKPYTNAITGEKMDSIISLPRCGYYVMK